MSFVVLNSMLEHLKRWYDLSAVEEVAINNPGEIWLRLRTRGANPWVKQTDHHLSRKYLNDLMHVIANTYELPFDPETGVPVVYTTLPGDHRFAGVAGKNVMYDNEDLTGGIAMSIRAHSNTVDYGFGDYGLEKGKELAKLQKKNIEEIKDPFDKLMHLIETGEPIIVSGATSTGKTTFLNNLLQKIDEKKRVITVEDTRELIVPNENHVHIMMSRTMQNNQMTYEKVFDLLVRMTPDIIIGGEISTSNARTVWDLMRTGHNHFYASIHAENPDEAFSVFAGHIARSSTNEISEEKVINEMKKKLHVVQLNKEGGLRAVTAVT